MVLPPQHIKKKNTTSYNMLFFSVTILAITTSLTDPLLHLMSHNIKALQPAVK
jgi:hypothetical protein